MDEDLGFVANVKRIAGYLSLWGVVGLIVIACAQVRL
jgi:hypothetical protein